MNRRNNFIKYPICIIKNKGEEPKFVYKTEHFFINYHNLKTTYPLNSTVLSNNASLNEYYRLKAQYKQFKIESLKKINGCFRIPSNRKENRIIRRNCHCLIIDTGEKPMLVYDLGDCYLNAYTMRKTYSKKCKILQENASKKTYHKRRPEVALIREIADTKKKNVNFENWIEMKINDEILPYIDYLTNSLNKERSNADEIIETLEKIISKANKNISEINNISEVASQRLVEIGRKCIIKRREIICSENTKQLLAINGVFPRKETPKWIKYKAKSFVSKSDGKTYFGILKREEEDKWEFIKIANSKSWLCFNTFKEAQDYIKKLNMEDNNNISKLIAN